MFPIYYTMLLHIIPNHHYHYDKVQSDKGVGKSSIAPLSSGFVCRILLEVVLAFLLVFVFKTDLKPSELGLAIDMVNRSFTWHSHLGFLGAKNIALKSSCPHCSHHSETTCHVLVCPDPGMWHSSRTSFPSLTMAKLLGHLSSYYLLPYCLVQPLLMG